MKKLLALTLCLIPSLAFGQAAVRQDGAVTRGNSVKWSNDHIIKDAGGLLGDNTGVGQNPFSILDSGSLGLCTNTAKSTGAYNRLCFGHDSSGNGVFDWGGLNGATNKNLNFNLNGGAAQFWLNGTDGTPQTATPLNAGDNSTRIPNTAWIQNLISGATQNLPLFTPEAYGAVGNGTTDDTTAFTNMCAAIQSAGNGYVRMGFGKTYRVAVGQNYNDGALHNLCSFTGSTGNIRFDFNGSKISVAATFGTTSSYAPFNISSTGYNFQFYGMNCVQENAVNPASATPYGTYCLFASNGKGYLLVNPQVSGGAAIADFAGDPNSIAGEPTDIAVINGLSTSSIYGIVTPNGGSHSRFDVRCIGTHDRCVYTYGAQHQEWNIWSENPSANDVLIAAGGINASATGTFTNGSTSVTGISSTAGIVVGMPVMGNSIPGDSIVTAKTSSTITLSQQATASGAATFTYGVRPTANLKLNYTVPARTDGLFSASYLTFLTVSSSGCPFSYGLLRNIEAKVDIDMGGDVGSQGPAILVQKSCTSSQSSNMSNIVISGQLKNVGASQNVSNVVDWNRAADAPWSGETQRGITFRDFRINGGNGIFRMDLAPVPPYEPAIFSNFSVPSRNLQNITDVSQYVDGPGSRTSSSTTIPAANSCMWIGGTTATTIQALQPINTTRYYGSYGYHAGEPNGYIPAPMDGTLKNLRVTLSAAPGVGNSDTATLTTGAGDTTLTCTIANSSTVCADPAHASAHVSPGTGIALKYSTFNGGSARSPSWSAQLCSGP